MLTRTQQAQLEHYQAMYDESMKPENPSTRTRYVGERRYEINLDGVDLVVYGYYEPADGDGINSPFYPASVSINSVCWLGSDLCILNMLRDSVIDRIQDVVDGQAEPSKEQT